MWRMSEASPSERSDHGVYFGACAEPDAFGHLGLRVAVGCGGGGVVAPGEDVAQPGARKSEFSGDEYRVAGACPAAALDVCVGDAADGRDIDRDACRRAGRVAPGERDAERFGEFPVAEHELFGPCAGRVGRERQRQQGAHRAGAHRSDVAQVYGKGFAPQFAGRSCGTQEMDAFGEHVGREDQRFALPDGEHGAIVADSFEPVVGQSGEEFFYVVYESEFGHGSRVCPAAAPRRPVRVFGFFTCGCRPGGGVPAWGRERSLCEPRQGRGRRLKSLFNGRCRTKVLKIL